MMLQYRFVHWSKDIYSDHIEKTAEWPAVYAYPSTPKKDIATKRAWAHNDRSVTDDISRTITSGWYYTSLIVVDHGVNTSEE